MKPAKLLLATSITMFNAFVSAHEGHGTPGTLAHDMQHQLWNFAALIALGAVLMAGGRLVAVLRVTVRRKREREERSRQDSEV